MNSRSIESFFFPSMQYKSSQYFEFLFAHSYFTCSKNMSWTAYLAPLNGVAPDSAIISLQGAHCGHVGNWKASQAEEMKYASLFSDLSSAQMKGLTYAGKKFIIVRAGDDVIISQAGKEGLVMQKSNTVIVAGHFGEGSVAGAVASRVDLIVRQLLQNNC